MPKKKKVLFIVPYPLHSAPSQRFRVELYFSFLNRNEIGYEVSSFFDGDTFSVLYNGGSVLRKAIGVLKGFARRCWLLIFRIHKYDYLFVHREASPLGPPFFEFVAAKVFQKKILYDFDDAIWIPDSKNKVLNWLKAFWKIKWICKWAHKVTAGNDYLCSYAKQYNDNVILLPTCVDVVNRHNRLKDQANEPVVIGWTGTHSTLKYLDPLLPVLQSVSKKYPVQFVIICNKPPNFSLPYLQFIPWKECSEIEDLLKMHIGIMPLHSDAWSEGKCGFKLIQYLSLGIAAVASPVGVNKQIIENGITGFLCTDSEWEKTLTILIESLELRRRIGKKGREKILSRYSIQANEGLFLSLFE